MIYHKISPLIFLCAGHPWGGHSSVCKPKPKAWQRDSQSCRESLAYLIVLRYCQPKEEQAGCPKSKKTGRQGQNSKGQNQESWRAGQKHRDNLAGTTWKWTYTGGLIREWAVGEEMGGENVWHERAAGSETTRELVMGWQQNQVKQKSWWNTWHDAAAVKIHSQCFLLVDSSGRQLWKHASRLAW